MTISTETETVIKKILPYLRRRGYDIETDLDFETPVSKTDRYERGYADILLLCGQPKPLAVIEAKRSAHRLTQKDREQALGYGKALGCLLAIVTNGSDIQCFNVSNNQAIRWDGHLTQKVPTRAQLVKVIGALKREPTLVDISLTGDSSLPFRPGLPLKQLNALFARCHNAIRKIEKDEDNVFADFSKLLFLKLLEEKADIALAENGGNPFKLPYSTRFYELAAYSDSAGDQVQTLVEGMIRAIREKTPYGEVLADPLRLHNPQTFLYLIRELAAVSFQDSSADSKGAAFEYFVRATLKGKQLGQYFTPRPLIEVMACLIGREKILTTVMAAETLKVLDPACGTGGFLVFLMQDNLRMLDEKLQKRSITAATHTALTKKIKESVFYGSDANQSVAATAKMNMIIAGDGQTNIRAEDSLSAAARNWQMTVPDCHIILTNPPFGTSEAQSLSASDQNAYPVHSTKGQLLFMQKMVMCTMPGGDICTVIDDGLLNTDSAAELRRWLLEMCRLIAVVELPDETFKPNKINVRASVLYLQRRAQADVDLADDYPITFASIDSLGYAGSGEPLRGFDLAQLSDEVAAKMLDTQRPIRQGYHWRAFNLAAHTLTTEPNYRFDVKYWNPTIRERITQMAVAHNPTVRDLSQIGIYRGVSPSVELYVDEADGYALVIKAGSNISKNGLLLLNQDDDYIEKSIYDGLTMPPVESGANVHTSLDLPEPVTRAKKRGRKTSRKIEWHSPQVQAGDVLLSSTGDGTLGKCCVYRADKPAIADGHVTIIRPDPTRVWPEYLADYLRIGFGAEQISRVITGSTGLVELTKDVVEMLRVNLLSGIDEQQRVSAQVRLAEAANQNAISDAQAQIEIARQLFADL